MKKTQKLRVTIEDLVYETTFEKLDSKLKPFAVKLFESGEHSIVELYTNKACAQLCVILGYIGTIPKDAGKRQIMCYDEQEFLAKQYK